MGANHNDMCASISEELCRVSDVDSKLTLLAGWGEAQVCVWGGGVGRRQAHVCGVLRVGGRRGAGNAPFAAAGRCRVNFVVPPPSYVSRWLPQPTCHTQPSQRHYLQTKKNNLFRA